MSKQHGTPLSTQFVQVLNAVTTAVATAVEDFSITELISILAKNGEKLTQYLRLVFTALMTGQGLALQPIVCSFPTWKTIKLGTLKNVDAIRQALKAQGYSIGSWADDILGMPAFTVSQEETQLDLVVVTVSELGFKNGATRKDIYDRAFEQGLLLCPSEVGPQLRLQYADQPMGEWMLVAMEPIAASDGGLDVFRVEHDGGGLWLGSDSSEPDDVWDAGDRWVFARRK